jgi:hypothetical protein
MKIKPFPYILLIVSLLVTLGAQPSYGFRCDTKIISVGDTKSRVTEACGPPTSITILLEGMMAWDYQGSSTTNRGIMDYGTPQPDSKQVTIEEWTYNPGPTHFMHHLEFENEVLKKIIAGERGY